MKRRSFIKWVAAAVHGLVVCALVVPGVAFLLGSLRRKHGYSSHFIPVAPLSALPVGMPVRRDVFTQRWDAFTHYPRSRIGRVWVLRTREDVRPSSLKVWQVTCPHLGCGIDFLPKGGRFSCPCHTSYFNLAGTCLGGPSPRDMDELEFRVTEADKAGQRWLEVKYQEFATGTSTKRPLM